MTAPRPAVGRFVSLIRERTGNVVPPARHHFVAEVLERRVRAVEAESVASYLDALADDREGEEWQRVIPMVTIKESYFFRAPQQFAALERNILPLLVAARSEERRLTVWSAAAARGEEAGTLAILFAESELLRGWDWEIVATDVDGEALETARRGLYGDRAVGHVPSAQLERWFRPRGKLYELLPALRRRITYRHLNLARPPYRPLRELTGGRPFDVVLLRNVLIYFGRPLQRRVVSAVGEMLADDGSLFLGASETLWQIQERLVAYDLGNCFCYRRRGAEEPDEPLRRLPRDAEAHPGEIRWDERRRETVQAEIVDVPWLDPRPQPTTGAGSQSPVEQAGPDSAPHAAPEAAPETEPVSTAEPSPDGPERSPGSREQDADRHEGRAPPPSEPPTLAAALAGQADDDAARFHAEPCGIQERLLQVARQLKANRFDAAGAELERVLEADPSEPAAHALDGFLHDLRSEPEEAISSYRAALYLDPALYQVRLLLADVMHRKGWRRRAEHEYREVLASLAAGRDRLLVPFEELPVPDRTGAQKRCRRALGR